MDRECKLSLMRKVNSSEKFERKMNVAKKENCKNVCVHVHV